MYMYIYKHTHIIYREKGNRKVHIKEVFFSRKSVLILDSFIFLVRFEILHDNYSSTMCVIFLNF